MDLAGFNSTWTSQSLFDLKWLLTGLRILGVWSRCLWVSFLEYVWIQVVQVEFQLRWHLTTQQWTREGILFQSCIKLLPMWNKLFPFSFPYKCQSFYILFKNKLLLVVSTCPKDVPVCLKTANNKAISGIRCTLKDFKWANLMYKKHQ